MIIKFFCTQIASDINNFLKKQVHPKIERAKELSQNDVFVLLTIWRQSNVLTPAKIADILSVDPASVSRSLVHLEGKQLVYTDSDRRDLRSKNVLLTDEGRAVCEEYCRCYTLVMDQMESRYDIGYTEDELQLIIQAMKIVARRTYILGTERREIEIPSLAQENSRDHSNSKFAAAS